MKVLVVAAHPDDEVLGAGATIARHVDQGDHVTIAILAEGLTARVGARSDVPAEERDALRRAAERACGIMGAQDLRLFDFPDNRMDSVDLLDVVKTVEGIMNDVQPDAVYTHHHSDLNIDHVTTARAVLTASRPLPGSSLLRLLAFEVPSATGWSFNDVPFKPTVFHDVGKTLKRKIAAMEAYDGELRPYPHPRSARALRARAESWGSHVGIDAAEPFELIREVA